MFDDAAQSTVLAIISVPQQMDVQETLQYFSEKESLIKMARILKTEFTRHYTIVLMFDSCAAADDFIYQYDDRQFNLLEEDRIIIKKVSSICTDHYIDPSLDVPASLKIKRKESEKYVLLENSPQSILHLTENLKTLEQEEKELVIRETEMHTFRDCPICLETFNDTDSVIVILCSHKFHYKCLREWRDQTCPICRYQQYPFELLFCEKCDIHENLWCCIICGLIGCGGLIPLSGHIRDHALESNHIYSKPILRDVNSTRQKGIFDHTTTDFVQSLSYNSQLGSIVANEANQCDKKDKKHKDVSEEINQLISSTLDSQRQFYKEEMRKLEAEFDKIKKDSTEMCNYIQAEIDTVQAELINMTSLVDDGRDSFHKLESIYHTLSEKLAALKRENQKLKKSKKGKEEVIERAREAKRQELAKIKKQIAEKLVEIKDMKVHIENKIKIEALPVQQGSSIMILGTGNKKSKK